MGSKGKERQRSLMSYHRLVEDESQGRARKGHVPVLVGRGEEVERFAVNVKFFNDPSMVALLEMAADELGDSSRGGVLRVTCDVDHFRRVVSVISKSKSR
ncbi:uncharacterized protein LOC109846413 [Asparagus officinalis]|nr:uncharacterized protein LOC109846413 [Asparagus officinalis]